MIKPEIENAFSVLGSYTAQKDSRDLSSLLYNDYEWALAEKIPNRNTAV